MSSYTSSLLTNCKMSALLKAHKDNGATHALFIISKARSYSRTATDSGIDLKNSQSKPISTDYTGTGDCVLHSGLLPKRSVMISLSDLEVHWNSRSSTRLAWLRTSSFGTGSYCLVSWEKKKNHFMLVGPRDLKSPNRIEHTTYLRIRTDQRRTKMKGTHSLSR